MKQTIVECPYCGFQYLLGELYIPKYLVGQPKHIERDYTGKIIYNEGIIQDNIERYNCDKCNKTFNIKAKISVQTSKLDARD